MHPSPRTTSRRLGAATLAILLAAGPATSRDIFVDQSFGGSGDGSPSAPFQKIQDGIDLALAGDRVVVARGVYAENLVVSGVSVALFAPEGPTVTTIDGGTLGSALVIDQAGAASVTGFKLTGGRAAHGGGVRLFFGEPTVTGCVITGNQAVQTAGIGGFGGGIYVYQAEAVITNNLVVGNSADIAGGGIGLGFTYFATVSYNTVVGNSALNSTVGTGPGIDVYYGAALQVSNNLVISNTTPHNGAGGLQVFESPATIATNVLFGNTPLQFVSSEGALPPGNLTTDPKFVSSVAGNYRLRVDSPALDSAGANPAPLLTDLDGNTRPVDGDLNGVAARDRGCYEQVGSLSGLAVSTASVVTWSPAPSAAAYHVYRSTIAGIRAGNFGGCQDARDPNLADTMFTEPDLPPSGTAFTFLATFSVNGAESSLGKTTAGAARAPAAYCP